MEGQEGYKNNEDQVPPSPKEDRIYDFVKLSEEKSALAALQAEREQKGQAPELDENGEDKITVRIAAIKAEIGTMKSPKSRTGYQDRQKEYLQKPEVRIKTRQEAERANKEREKATPQRRPIADRRKFSLPRLRPSPIPSPQPI